MDVLGKAGIAVTFPSYTTSDIKKRNGDVTKEKSLRKAQRCDAKQLRDYQRANIDKNQYTGSQYTIIYDPNKLIDEDYVELFHTTILSASDTGKCVIINPIPGFGKIEIKIS
jgi:hypothetical protein